MKINQHRRTKNVGFATLKEHGKMKNNEGEDCYYFVMSTVDGIELYESVQQKHSLDIWRDHKNIKLFSTYLLNAIRILFEIFGENFRHYDLHPSNIFVHIEEQKVEKVSIIDFDLIDSDCFKVDLGLDLPCDGHHSLFSHAGTQGVNSKMRRFLCYCLNYDENISMEKTFVICVIQLRVIPYANLIQNIDIKHWYLISFSLIELRRKLINITIDDDTINLKDIYDADLILQKLEESLTGTKVCDGSSGYGLPDVDFTFDNIWLFGGKRRRKTLRKQRRKTLRKRRSSKTKNVYTF
jgi:hypothetical protein